MVRDSSPLSPLSVLFPNLLADVFSWRLLSSPLFFSLPPGSAPSQSPFGVPAVCFRVRLRLPRFLWSCQKAGPDLFPSVLRTSPTLAKACTYLFPPLKTSHSSEMARLRSPPLSPLPPRLRSPASLSTSGFFYSLSPSSRKRRLREVSQLLPPA